MVAHNTTQQGNFRKKLIEIRPPICQSCGNGFPYESLIADHIIPSWRDGSNDPDTNGQLLCAACEEIKTREENKLRPTPLNGKAGPPARKKLKLAMDRKRPADMTDTELLQEWSCIEDCDFSTTRTDDLRAELEKRQLDF